MQYKCRQFKKSSRWPATIAVIGMILFVVGCGEEPMAIQTLEPCGDDETCDVEVDCNGDDACESDQLCQSDFDCDSPPASTCQADNSLLAYLRIGICTDSGQNTTTCRYVADVVSCDYGCSQGECHESPCTGEICSTPPAPSCDDDGVTLLSYSDTGVCEGLTGCSYTLIPQTCVHGCDNDACRIGVCDDHVCQQQVADRCEGNVALKYSENGTCYEDNSAATCYFPIEYENCTYTRATCNQGQCEDGISQKGSVVIVEYMVNPKGMWSGVGQWFEILNVSGSPIDLTNWTLRSGGPGGEVQEHVITIPPVFPTGARLLFANSTDPAQNGTLIPHYVYSRYDITLHSLTDWIELRDADGEVVDYVYYEPGSIMEGRARMLNPDVVASAQSNDDFSNWCPNMAIAYGEGPNYGTPGSDNSPCMNNPCDGYSCVKPRNYCNSQGNAVVYTEDFATCQVSRFNNPFCDFGPMVVECDASTEMCHAGECIQLPSNLPEPNEIVITELMGNPTGQDAVAEWIEIYNRTDRELALFSLDITDNEEGSRFDSYTIVDRKAAIAPHGYAVFVRDTDALLNGGIEGGYYYSGNHLKDSPDEGMLIRLVRRDGVVINEAHYGKPKLGVSQQLHINAYKDNDDFDPQNSIDKAYWCESTEAFGDGDLGTPGSDNGSCAQ